MTIQQSLATSEHERSPSPSFADQLLQQWAIALTIDISY